MTAEQIAAGKRLGEHLRRARGGRTLVDVAVHARISPETLRKIEAGRLVTPGFPTVVAIARSLEIPLDELADICLGAETLGETG
ncbi:hypothetical protein GOARA_050_00520 [Gordonia araii NBRC 100433]|uniref:HTH cro/C1-type domain-containing protein n=1 Tax=Gordonia araii NBRC 100433 TaxID=1073574 RepID=G7H2B5_9ACTN|nr:hypothetical protein GOARA_050_00520 [Gordonia araii NBRC 100433]